LVFGILDITGGSYLQGYLVAVSFCGTVLVLVSGPLWLAWRFVGARGHYRKALINATYQLAFACFFFFLAGAVCCTLLKLWDQKLVANTYQSMTQAPPDRWLELVLARVADIPGGRGKLVAYGSFILIQALGILWLIRSWGAFRLVLEASRLRSVLAACLFLLLLGGLPLFLFWSGSGQAHG